LTMNAASRCIVPVRRLTFSPGFGSGFFLCSPMPDKYKPPYQFSTHIGSACAKQCRSFTDLAEKLKMDVTDLMRQCNGEVSPSKALVKGLAEELDIDEAFLKPC
jgi:hypothetical protein